MMTVLRLAHATVLGFGLATVCATPSTAAPDRLSLPGVFPQETAAVQAKVEAPIVRAAPVRLKASATVPGEHVRLGDLFDNIGALAGQSVAAAPPLGQRTVFDAAWLANVAQAYGLDWRPQNSLDRIVVERPAQTVTPEAVRREMRAVLRPHGLSEDEELEMPSRVLHMLVPVDRPAQVSVEDINFDRRTRRFSLTLVAPAGDPAAMRVPVVGHAVRVAAVPVLTRRVETGEVIAEGDVAWIRLPADRLGRDVLTAADDIVGMTPRRTVQPGTPIQGANLRRPLLVERDRLVTIVLKTPTMTLTAQGKALDNGAVGDVVRIMNTQSKNTIEARVIGLNQVTVTPAMRIVMN